MKFSFNSFKKFAALIIIFIFALYNFNVAFAYDKEYNFNYSIESYNYNLDYELIDVDYETSNFIDIDNHSLFLACAIIWAILFGVSSCSARP